MKSIESSVRVEPVLPDLFDSELPVSDLRWVSFETCNSSVFRGKVAGLLMSYGPHIKRISGVKCATNFTIGDASIPEASSITSSTSRASLKSFLYGTSAKVIISESFAADLRVRLYSFLLEGRSRLSGRLLRSELTAVPDFPEVSLFDSNEDMSQSKNSNEENRNRRVVALSLRLHEIVSLVPAFHDMVLHFCNNGGLSFRKVDKYVKASRNRKLVEYFGVRFGFSDCLAYAEAMNFKIVQ
jgi:hypothetical protein